MSWWSLMPEFSVIVPTYNRPGMLKRALHSIDAQGFQDYEILVVNDGGENMTPITKHFPRAVYLAHERNRGLPAARNTALKAARGEFIAYLDDDDIWFPNHLQTCWDALSSGQWFVYTDSYFWFNEREYRMVMSVDYSRAALLKHNLTPAICVAHRRDLLKMCGMFDEGLPNHEDYDLWLRMSEHTEFKHIPAVTCAYSKRDDASQMSSNAAKMLDGLQHVQQRYQERVTA